MRLMFVCRQFGDMAGGVEWTATNLMNELDRRGHAVSLFTWDPQGARTFFPLNESITWYRLNMGDPVQKAGFPLRVRRVRRFRGFVRGQKPEAVIGFQHGAFLFAAASLPGRRVPVVLAERNAPDRMDHISEGRFRHAVFQSMRLAAAITVQLESYVERYPAYLRPRIVAIPNPVYAPDGFASPGTEKSVYTLLSVGRLSYQKNYDSLIRAFAAVAGEFPRWKLRIVGEGERRRELESLVSRSGLGPRIEMGGATKDVSAEYRSADLFCLSSLWEGFPNTLAEAMAHGLPCVAYRGCAGANELIRDGDNGVLASGNGDVGTLSSQLRRLMNDGEKRVALGERAKTIARDYEPGGIYDRWEELFRKVATGR